MSVKYRDVQRRAQPIAMLITVEPEGLTLHITVLNMLHLHALLVIGN